MNRYVVVCLLTVAACDEKAPPEPASPEPTTAVEPSEPAKAAEPAAAEKEDEPHPSIANLTDEQWCEVAHADTVKLVEGIKASMKRTGQEDPSYAPPEKGPYVELCRKLPLEMQKCLVMAHAMQNKDACQAAHDAMSPDARAAYTELMGK